MSRGIHWPKLQQRYFLQYTFAYEKGGDARRKFWINPLKETDLGVAQAFLTPKRELKIYVSNLYFYILLRATLNEAFTAKYEGILPRTP